jgi:phenylalanyl-tRNA synthetase beta chain
MLIPVNWLNDYIAIKDIKKINDILLQAGLEVEEILDYKNKEKILKVEVTPNRGDWASIVGVARELAALTNKRLKKPNFKITFDSSLDTKDNFDLTIKASKACRAYSAYQIKGINVTKSSLEIQTRLDQIGEKAVNNIVDATNYAMFELGQPLHAFDADKIEGEEVIVRFAKKGEKIHLINGKVVELTNKDLVIADSNKPIALAGIMGGLETEITKKTQNILLESAWFDPKTIRATLKRHQKKNLDTQASYRFERYVDPEITNQAAELALSLITKSSNKAKIAKPTTKKERPFKQSKVKLDIKKINRLTGLKLKKPEIIKSLKAFGFKIKGSQVSAPSWRSDISIVPDLAEEVARYYGYNNLPEKELDKQDSQIANSQWYRIELLKDYISNHGFLEVYNYSFINPEDVEIFSLPQKELLEVVNPVDPDNKYMRNSLVPGLIKSLAKNQQESKLAIFEIGQTFDKKLSKNKIGQLRLGLTSYGLKKDKLKLLIKDLEDKLEVKSLQTYYHRNDDNNSKVFNQYKIRKPSLHLVEFNLKEATLSWLNGEIEQPPETGFSYQTVSKYPEVSRDLAFLVDQQVEAKKIEEYIKKLDELIVRVELFDEFAHEKFGKNKKNIAYHIFFQAPDRTLTDKEVDKLITRTISNIEEKFEARLRK